MNDNEPAPRDESQADKLGENLTSMRVEIERKFLVANEEWKHAVVHSVSLRDGLIAACNGRKVRVRIAGNTATIAVKGPRTGIARAEYEYEIPLADAEHILSTICRDDTLEKQRFFVEDAGAIWHVDVHGGILSGFVIAEIELRHATEQPALPRWVGREVTGDPHYSQTNMVARRTGATPTAMRQQPTATDGPRPAAAGPGSEPAGIPGGSPVLEPA
jgi:CYTH domain-containing protein